MNLRWQILRRALHELALIADSAAFLVQEEGATEVDDFEGAYQLLLFIVVDNNVVRLEVTMHD